MPYNVGQSPYTTGIQAIFVTDENISTYFRR